MTDNTTTGDDTIKNAMFSSSSSSSSKPGSSSSSTTKPGGFIDLDYLSESTSNLANRITNSIPSSSSSSSTNGVVGSSSSRTINATQFLENIMGSGEFGTRGEIWVVAQFAVLGFIVFGGDNVPLFGPLLRYWIGPSLIISGLSVLVTGSSNLGPLLSPWTVPITTTTTGTTEGDTTTNNDNNNILVTDGMFQFVRHPLYGGLLLASIGLSIVTDSVVRLVLTGILFLVLNYKTILEEDALLNKYGIQYQTYKQSVSGKFIPKELLNGFLVSMSSSSSTTTTGTTTKDK
jgi:protein-S-isoprenylcysteine O-methyltransferase Ste14